MENSNRQQAYNVKKNTYKDTDFLNYYELITDQSCPISVKKTQPNTSSDI